MGQTGSGRSHESPGNDWHYPKCCDAESKSIISCDDLYQVVHVRLILFTFTTMSPSFLSVLE